MQIYDRTFFYVDKHQRAMVTALNLSACLLLLVATVYSAKAASFHHTYSSDAIIFPYFFKGFHFNDTVVAIHHSNLLKFPLFLLQAHLPYNFITYSAVTIGLVISTIGSWAALLMWIFGKKYTAIICILLSLLVLGSPMFVNDLTGSTIRNIEYPLGLGFIILISSIILGRKISRGRTVAGVSIFILFGIAVAGDSLLEYCFVLPGTLAVVILWFKHSIGHKQAIQALSLLIGVIVFSLFVQRLINLVGIVGYYNPPAFEAHTVPANALSFSITTAAQQLLSMFGGYLLGLHEISPSRSIIYFNFLILAAAIFCFWIIIKKNCQSHIITQHTLKQKDFIILALGISFFITFVIYILADQVVRPLPDGTLISRGNSRYLSLLPLLGVTGIVYFLKANLSKNRLVLYLLPIIAVLVVILSLP